MRQTPDDDDETASFKIADEKLCNMRRRLRDKNVCECCTARALAYHAANALERSWGSAEAIELLEGIIIELRERNVPAPAPMPSTEAH